MNGEELRIAVFVVLALFGAASIWFGYRLGCKGKKQNPVDIQRENYYSLTGDNCERRR